MKPSDASMKRADEWLSTHYDRGPATIESLATLLDAVRDASLRRAREWMHMMHHEYDDTGEPFPGELNQLAALLDAVRDEALEEAATMAEKWGEDVREPFPEQAIVAGMFAQKVRALKVSK